MFKKLLSLILCAMILLSFAACNKSTSSDISSTESAISNQTIRELGENDYPTEPVFNTKNIVRITFYAYYGQGIGSDVPSKNLTEIINWLDSFTIDREATDEDAPPGTNTYYVEIEYSDGTIIKEGLDIIIIDGTKYLLEKEPYPNCFMGIISKASLG